MLFSLPLDVIMIVTSELYPKIQGLKSSLSGPTANTAIVDLLRNAALQEHLPKPPPLSPRRFSVSSCVSPLPLSNVLTLGAAVDGRLHCLANFAHLG